MLHINGRDILYREERTLSTEIQGATAKKLYLNISKRIRCKIQKSWHLYNKYTSEDTNYTTVTYHSDDYKCKLKVTTTFEKRNVGCHAIVVVVFAKADYSMVEELCKYASFLLDALDKLSEEEKIDELFTTLCM